MGVMIMTVKKGDKVKVEYTGTLDDGTVFDSSEKHGVPLEFEAGSGQVIPGFDNAIMGMEVGEEKKIDILPTEAYGEHNDKLIKKVPKDKLPDEVKVGTVRAMTLPNGAQMPAKVTDVTDNEVTIDLNHPLAGKTLHFKVKVVAISS